MCENAYLSIKNPKASRALKRALDPGHRMLAWLARLRFAMSATFGPRSWGSPLDQILDPHLDLCPHSNQSMISRNSTFCQGTVSHYFQTCTCVTAPSDMSSHFGMKCKRQKYTRNFLLKLVRIYAQWKRFNLKLHSQNNVIC